jgi:hypothetical protein
MRLRSILSNKIYKVIREWKGGKYRNELMEIDQSINDIRLGYDDHNLLTTNKEGIMRYIIIIL